MTRMQRQKSEVQEKIVIQPKKEVIQKETPKQEPSPPKIKIIQKSKKVNSIVAPAEQIKKKESNKKVKENPLAGKIIAITGKLFLNRNDLIKVTKKLNNVITLYRLYMIMVEYILKLFQKMLLI